MGSRIALRARCVCSRARAARWGARWKVGTLQLSIAPLDAPNGHASLRLARQKKIFGPLGAPGAAAAISGTAREYPIILAVCPGAANKSPRSLKALGVEP